MTPAHHPPTRGRLPAVVLCCVLAACAAPGAAPPPGHAPLSAERIAQVVAQTDRTTADRETDRRRKPELLLGFIGPWPGMVALDVSAGGGYTSELLARAIGPTGTVYGQSAPVGGRPATNEDGSAVRTPLNRRSSPTQLAIRNNEMRAQGDASAAIVPVIRPFEDPAPPELADGGLDLVTLMFNYHDLGHLGVDRARMNAALFKALKPGGLYVIADHSGRPGTGISESDTLHRIERSFLVDEVKAAGFRLVAEGDFLRNPADPRDRATPEPPQPKDEFVLKFVKPR